MTANGKNDVVILATARTPQGRFLGGLATLSAVELGKIALKTVVERSGIDAADVDEFLLGNVVSAGTGQALHRQVSTELDPEERRELFIQLNDMLIEDVAVIPLVQISEIPAISKSLVGFEPTPWDSEVWNIKDWRRE